jgi:hypothetical protein
LHALLRRRAPPRGLAASLVAAGVAILLLSACREKVTPAQCDALVARYAELVVREKMPTAGVEEVRAEQKRVRVESAGDENFRNCPTEVRPSEYECAMSAATPTAIEKCLE